NEDPHSTPAVVIPKAYRIYWDAEVVRAHVEKYEAKEYLQLKPERLQWSPFLVTRYGVEPPPPAPEMTADILNDGDDGTGPSGGELNGSVEPVGPEKSRTPAATFDPSPHVNGTHSPQVFDREEASEPEEPDSEEEVDVVEEAEYEEPAEEDEESDYDEEDEEEEAPRLRLRLKRKAVDALDAPASRLRRTSSIQTPAPSRRSSSRIPRSTIASYSSNGDSPSFMGIEIKLRPSRSSTGSRLHSTRRSTSPMKLHSLPTPSDADEENGGSPSLGGESPDTELHSPDLEVPLNDTKAGRRIPETDEDEGDYDDEDADGTFDDPDESLGIAF
ncbi:hypothetical protein P7C70_g8528, partial [Phenoliferia sp. Uapishka_3]